MATDGKGYKKFDSQDSYEIHNARLISDAKVRPGEKGGFVTVTFVSSSRKDNNDDVFIDADVGQRQLEVAAFLKKLDNIGVRGKPVWYTGNDGKQRMRLEYAELFIPPALFAEIKERGFSPGGAAPAAAKAKATKAKREIVNLDDEE